MFCLPFEGTPKGNRLKKVRKIKERFRLHQGNASPHKSLIALKKAIECGFELLPHPPYSFALAPPDHHLLPYMTKQLRGHKFKDNDEAKHALRKVLEEFPADFFKEVRSRSSKEAIREFNLIPSWLVRAYRTLVVYMFDFFLPPKKETKLIGTLVHRALLICSIHRQRQELDNIKTIIHKNVYQNSVIQVCPRLSPNPVPLQKKIPQNARAT